MSNSKIFLSNSLNGKKTSSSFVNSSFQSPVLSLTSNIDGEEGAEEDRLVSNNIVGSDSVDPLVTQRKNLRSSVWKYATKVSSDVGQCNVCSKTIKTTTGGTTTLRKHLLRKHNITDVAHRPESSRKTINKTISKQRKARLDQLVKIAIFEDGRTFGDFRKSGIMKFISEAIPGKNYAQSSFLHSLNIWLK